MILVRTVSDYKNIIIFYHKNAKNTGVSIYSVIMHKLFEGLSKNNNKFELYLV